MKQFTKAKFLKLELKQKHKKCALVLREIYEALLNKKTDPKALFSLYNTFAAWLELEPFYNKNLKKVSDLYHHHLSMGKLSLKEHNLLPFIRKGDRAPKKDFGNCTLYLEQLRSAYNVGSILRTVEAFRLGPIYFHPKTPFVNHDKVKKTSMGADQFVPCHVLKNLQDLPRPWVALETLEKGLEISEFIFPPSFTLIVGNEEYGVSDEILKKANYALKIPLLGFKNSLNVACAFAIAAQEIQKQQ